MVRMDPRDRAARNEEVFRSVNERIEKGAELHGISSPIGFHCECASASCVETISIEPDAYLRVAEKRARFLVLHGHQQPEIERVVEEHELFLVVEKIGEAREQIERDHLQA